MLHELESHLGQDCMTFYRATGVRGERERERERDRDREREGGGGGEVRDRERR